jgi:hypothetical protein
MTRLTIQNAPWDSDPVECDVDKFELKDGVLEFDWNGEHRVIENANARGENA